MNRNTSQKSVLSPSDSCHTGKELDMLDGGFHVTERL